MSTGHTPSVEALLDAFEEAWRRAPPPPTIDDYLPAPSHPGRAAALLSLARADLERRLRKLNEPARVEGYLACYPELAGDPKAALELIGAEYALRRHTEPALCRQDYIHRFPRYARQLEAALPGATEAPSRRHDPDEPWPGGERNGPDTGGYQILGELGRGGMGVVHTARDRRTGRVVALKTMQRRDGTSLEFFKREFRYLQGVSHPNLVQLYALEFDGRDWLLTMELVEGVDFLTHVRPGAETSGHQALPVGALGPLDEGRLREALGQLAEGVQALHAHRRVHRDLKPQNVRVTSEGRVVVLDFGLAADLPPGGEHVHTGEALLGTFAYMAPEQGEDVPVSSPASDWYSVGVMLYQALTGRLPFSGNALQMMRAKQALEPPPPSRVCPGVAEDLDALCLSLLRRSPADRPSGAEILQRLARRPPAPPAGLAGEEAPLLGREPPLRTLEEAFADSRRGRAVFVSVHGPSGIGKSFLVRRFLDRLRGQGAVVLAGRCYERESVPYKALDPVVDEVGRYLRSLPRHEVEALLPRDGGPLTRVFPVLGSITALAEAAARSTRSPDPQEVRRRAVAGLRELLARVGDRRPLVLHIDDLQWGDVDSAHLLADLLRPPDPPPLLLLASYRSADADSPCLRALAEALGRGEAVDRRELVLTPLSGVEAQELARLLLGSGADEYAAEVAQESGGNPFFVTELAQEVQTGPPPSGLTLEGLIRTRVGRLSEGARRLLEVIAVSARPLGEAVACRAARADDEWRGLVARLESARLVRGVGAADESRLEVYHDRIREAVAAGLHPDVLREHHRHLALALEASGGADPEEVAGHFEAAGEPERAGAYYALAAGSAAEALAFDRAANLYRRALALRPVAGEEGRQLRAKLGEALANAGRGAEAGAVFLELADGAEGVAQLELRRRAANEFLLSGCVREGLDALRALLGAFGMKLLSTAGGPRRVLFPLLLERLRLRLASLTFRERPDEAIPAEELLRIDVCHTAAQVLTVMDMAQGIVFQKRHLRLAFQAGSPSRVAAGLAAEAAVAAFAGGRSRRRVEALRGRAMCLAQRLNQPFLLAKATFYAGAMSAWGVGRWEECLALCERAVQIAAEGHVSFAEELAKLQHVCFECLNLLGRWREIGRRAPSVLADARRRGDRFAANNTLVHSYVTCLAASRPDDVDEVHRLALEGAQEGFYLVNYWAPYGRVEAALYRGEGQSAWDVADQTWSFLTGSAYIAHIEPLFLLLLHLRARAALATAESATGGERYFGHRARLLRVAAGCARRIERRRMPWANPLAQLTRAGLAAVRGRMDESLALLHDAEEGFAAAHMTLYAAAARRQRGRLLGGEQGRLLVGEADDRMAGQDIREPARVAAVLAPGFGGGRA